MHILLLSKEKLKGVNASVELPEIVKAPISSGDTVGRIVYTLDGKIIGEAPILAAEAVDKISFFEILLRLLSAMAIS